MTVTELLGHAENRAAVAAIARRVLGEIEPEEVELTAGMFEPLVDEAADGNLVFDRLLDEAGRFGAPLLLAPNLVLLVATALGELLSSAEVTTVSQFTAQYTVDMPVAWDDSPPEVPTRPLTECFDEAWQLTVMRALSTYLMGLESSPDE